MLSIKLITFFFYLWIFKKVICLPQIYIQNENKNYKINKDIGLKATGSCVTIRGIHNPQRCIQSTSGRNIIEGITLFKIEHKGQCLLQNGNNIVKGDCSSNSILYFMFTNESYQRYHLYVYNRSGSYLGIWNNQMDGQIRISTGQLIPRIYIRGERDNYGINFLYHATGAGGVIIERIGYSGFVTVPNTNTLSWQSGALWFDFLSSKLII